jgi:hypothetical protein
MRTSVLLLVYLLQGELRSKLTLEEIDQEEH